MKKNTKKPNKKSQTIKKENNLPMRILLINLVKVRKRNRRRIIVIRRDLVIVVGVIRKIVIKVIVLQLSIRKIRTKIRNING